jgi:hypothetical protein
MVQAEIEGKQEQAQPLTKQLLGRAWQGLKKGVEKVITYPENLVAQFYESRDPFIMTLEGLRRSAANLDKKSQSIFTPGPEKAAYKDYNEGTIMPTLQELALHLEARKEAQKAASNASDIAYPGWRASLNEASIDGRTAYIGRLERKVDRTIKKVNKHSK